MLVYYLVKCKEVEVGICETEWNIIHLLADDISEDTESIRPVSRRRHIFVQLRLKPVARIDTYFW